MSVIQSSRLPCGQPCEPNLKSSSAGIPATSAFSPTATITVSQGIVSSESGTGTTVGRPLSSGGPSRVACTLIPSTWPVPRISSGIR
jgi:hypothetical protein